MRVLAAAPLLLLALAAGCGGDEPQAVSTTIAPRDPSQAPPLPGPSFRAEPVGRRVVPWVDPSSTPKRDRDVMITGGAIEVTPLLPRQYVYLLVRNMTDETHEIRMTGGGDTASVTVEPHGTATLQGRLREGTYELTCTLPGHWEHGRFETYEQVQAARPYPVQ